MKYFQYAFARISLTTKISILAVVLENIYYTQTAENFSITTLIWQDQLLSLPSRLLCYQLELKEIQNRGSSRKLTMRTC